MVTPKEDEARIAATGLRGSALGDEASLCARAAWLYFSGGLTQRQIAERLGVPSTKAHRLVARATREGLVRIIVDASVSECVALEEALGTHFGLEYCRVAPDIEDAPLPLRALGTAGANFLRNTLERGTHKDIGIGHGRTLAAAVNAMASKSAADTRFVSLLGGLTRRFAANPFDVIHHLAGKTGAEAYLMPVPLFANSAHDKRVLMAQMGVAEVFEMGRAATLLVVGVGEVGGHAHLRETGMVSEAELEELRRSGAEGEMLGHYFDVQGQPVHVSLNERAMSLSVAELEGRNTVAIAGGQSKIEALRAVLRSGLLKGLITDETTARGLVE